MSWTEITPITGHIQIPPPLSLGCAMPSVCAPDNLRLDVRREGRQDLLATYPAQTVDGLWDFVIDDVWREAPTGFYVATVRCCNDAIHCFKVRKRKLKPGEATTLDIKMDMCADPGDMSCAVAAPCPCPCPTETTCNYESPQCEPTCPVITGTIPPMECVTNPIQCDPCVKETKKC
jgi:hypothetical protein